MFASLYFYLILTYPTLHVHAVICMQVPGRLCVHIHGAVLRH